jgi:hypothetical protein
MGEGLPPNSSPSKVRLNPDEPNPRLLVSSRLKVSPPRVRVEAKFLAFILAFCKKDTHSTSPHRVVIAKPLGRDKKLSVKSSGLSVAEKASLAGIGTAKEKPKRALNLFDSDSSASDDDIAPSQRPRKRVKDSSISKQVAKPALTRGMFE